MAILFKDKCEETIDDILSKLSEEELEDLLDLPDSELDQEDLRDVMRWLGKHDIGSLV